MVRKEIINYQEACIELARAFCDEYKLVDRDIDFERMEMKFIAFEDKKYCIKLRDMYTALTRNVQRDVCDKWIARNYRIWADYGLYIPLKEFIENE